MTVEIGSIVEHQTENYSFRGEVMTIDPLTDTAKVRELNDEPRPPIKQIPMSELVVIDLT